MEISTAVIELNEEKDTLQQLIVNPIPSNHTEDRKSVV